MDMLFSELLSTLRNKKGITKTALANSVGVSLTYIAELEKARKRAPNIEICYKIAKALSLNKTDQDALIKASTEDRIEKQVLEWYAEKGEIQQVPLISWVHANNFGEAVDNFPVGIADETVSYVGKCEQCFALRVKYDCMTPEFLDGDIIIINPKIEAHSGDFVVVRDDKSNEATFKQYKKYGRKVILHPLNPKYSDIELDHSTRYHIVGVVVEKVKKYR